MADDKKSGMVPVRLIIDNGEEIDVDTTREGSGDGGGEPDLRPVEFSDDALAKALSDSLTDDWRCVTSSGEWYRWTGQRWELEKSLLILFRARMVCRAVANRCETPRIARQVSSKSAIYAAARIAGEDRKHATPLEAFDANSWLLNTPAGIVDLRSGVTLPHSRDAMMTRMTTVSAEGDAPFFYGFLREATGLDIELQKFIQRIAGYCLTADISEHAIFFLYGPGGTGKSVLLNVMLELLADYATTAPMDMFTVSTGERHPTELATLHGARLVTASETEEGRRWDEAKLKAITGGDRITARFMRGNFFTFRPTFKLFMAGNYRPAMRSADDAMRRRFHVIPFTHKPKNLDKTLSDKLKAELGGILKWAVEGAVEWQRIGLAPPKGVVEATDDYFAAEDAIGRWMDERCQLKRGADFTAFTRDLYRDFKSWAAMSGEYVPSERKFAQRLEKRDDLTKWRHPVTRGRGFEGVQLIAEPGTLPFGRAVASDTPLAPTYDDAGAWEADEPENQ